MLTTIILSVVVPSVVGVSWLALRTRLPRTAADARGIALQTVIIMVVLLAIAGAIAGVLITRGDEAAENLESQQIVREAGDYTTERLCDAAGFTWVASSTTCTG